MHHESPSLPASAPQLDCDVLILGGGTASIGVAATLRLALKRIESQKATRGRHGVTSNYRFDLATQTWSPVRTVNHPTYATRNPLVRGHEWLAQPSTMQALVER